jgi:hypothetical protein
MNTSIVDTTGADGLSMGCEAFGVSEAQGGGAELLDALFGIFLDGDELDEVESAETAACAGEAAGG